MSVRTFTSSRWFGLDRLIYITTRKVSSFIKDSYWRLTRPERGKRKESDGRIEAKHPSFNTTPPLCTEAAVVRTRGKVRTMTLIWSTWSGGARTCTAQLLTGERRADRCTVGLASGPCGAASREPGGGSRIEPVQCNGASVGSALGYLICMSQRGVEVVWIWRESERERGEEQRKEETWTLHLRASRHRPACCGCEAAHTSRLWNTNRSA